MCNFVLQSKRKEIRIPYCGTVRFSANQFNWYLNNAQNISQKGIFIKTDEEFTVGTKLYLNFDLTVNDEVVRKIRTIGEVVRLACNEEKGAGVESAGLGIHFSLLPGQEVAMRAFVEDVVDSSLAGVVSVGESAKHICVEVQDKTAPLIMWWLQEITNKVLSTNGLILELAVILIFIVVGVIVLL